jgi:hypothetical protein
MRTLVELPDGKDADMAESDPRLREGCQVADKAEQDMSNAEIRGVFETLKLPIEPKPVPLAAPTPGTPVVFFTVSGNSPPPLNTR